MCLGVINHNLIALNLEQGLEGAVVWVLWFDVVNALRETGLWIAVVLEAR
jgi:hypothetical protein